MAGNDNVSYSGWYTAREVFEIENIKQRHITTVTRGWVNRSGNVVTFGMCK